MSLDLGNLAQWASVAVAVGSLMVALCGSRIAKRASKEASAARLEINRIEVQVANLSIKSGGSGGSGGQFGGGGGGGGGSGQSGGDGGDFHVHV